MALLAGATALGGAVPGAVGTGTECTETVSGKTTRAIEKTVASASAGSVICVPAGIYESKPVEIRQSGKPDAPIEVRALGRVVLRGVEVEANHVAIVGFEITPPRAGPSDGAPTPGVALQGKRLVVADNLVHDTHGNGIECLRGPPSCSRARISGNTIRRADGTGILVLGRNNRIVENDIAESLRVRSGDADGVRFFGNGHVIRSNRVHDISAGSSGDDAPHTDCFQTFDNGKPPTFDIVIDGNICSNVDHQCLIATAERSAELDRIGRSRSLRFTNNICRNNGSQGVLVEQFPDVVVAFNAFADTIQDRAAIFLNGSSEGAFLNNIVDGNYRAYELDESSAQGWSAQRNLRPIGWPGVPPIEPGVETVDLLLAAPPDAPAEERYQPLPGSGVIDAGVAVPGVDRDLAGTRRPLDGAAIGQAIPDVGPYEYRSDHGSDPQQK